MAARIISTLFVSASLVLLVRFVLNFAHSLRGGR